MGPLNPFYRSPLAGTTVYTGDSDKYKDYNVPLTPYGDIDEARAQNQSAWEQVRNGFGKAAVTAAGATAENTLGYAMGLGDFVLSGFEDFDESMTNNPVGRFVDEANEYAREHLPNYYTKEEEANTGKIGNIFTANFLADKFLNGAAYSLGSIASMYLTGGTGLVAKGLLGAGKMSNAMAALKAARAVKSGKPIREAMQAGASLNRAKNAFGYLEGGAMMSIAESAVESREVGKRVKEELQQEFMQQRGLSNPNDIPAHDRARIEQFAEEQETLAFYGNMAVLMPTNLMMFGKALRPFKAGKDATNTIVKTAAKEGEKKAYITALDNLPGYAQKGVAVGQKIAPFIEGAAIEAFQEGAQYSISEALNDYALAKYKEDDGSAELADGLLQGAFYKSAKDASAVLGEQIMKTVNSPEGREQMLIGGLVGLLSGGLGGGGRSRRKAKDKATKNALDKFNLSDQAFVGMSERADHNKLQKLYIKMMEGAREAGDQESYDNARHALLAHEAMFHIEHGTTDMYKDRLEELKNLPAEEFAKVMNMDTATKEEQTKIIDDVIESAERMEMNYNAIYDRFPGTTPSTGLKKALMSKEALKEEKASRQDEELMRRSMLYYSSVQGNRTTRTNDALDRISELDTQFDRSVVDIFRDSKYNQRQEGEEKQTQPDRAEYEREKAATIERVSQLDAIAGEIVTKEFEKIEGLMDERDRAYNAYKELMTNPTERRGYLQRQRAKQEALKQEKLDALGDKAVEETNTDQELSEKLTGLKEAGVSDEKLDELRQVANDRRNQAAAAEMRFARMKTSELKGLLNDDSLSAIERAAIQRELEELRPEGQEAPRERSPQPTTESVNKDVNESAQEADGTQSNKSAQEKLAEKANKKKVGRGAGELQTRHDGQGELSASGDTHLVSTSGELLPNPEYHTVGEDEKPLIDGREMLATPDLVGREVILRPVETNWWLREGQRLDPENPHIHMPIAVEIDGKVIGVLGSGNTQMRKAVLDNPTGSITTTITDRMLNNLITATSMENNVATGSPFFFNPQDLGDSYLAVVRINSQGELYYDLNLPEDMEAAGISAEEQEALTKSLQKNEARLNELREDGSERLAPGQLVMFRRDPNGDLRVIVGSTSNLTEADVQFALDQMAKGDQEALKALVGLNAQYDLEAMAANKAQNSKRLLSEAAGDLVLYTFDPLDAQGNRVLKPGEMAQVSDKMIARMMAGEMIPWNELEPIERQKMVVIPTVSAEGGVNTKGRPESDTDAQARGKDIYENLQGYLTNLLQNKKIHVEASLLNQTRFGSKEAFPHPAGRRTAPYNNYEEYLFDPQNGQQGNGFSGIFRVQTKERNGTVYTDVGLKFSPAYKVNGEQVDPATTVVAEPKQEKKPAKPQGAKPKKKTRKSRSKTGKKGGVSKEKFESQKEEGPTTSGGIVTGSAAQIAKVAYESLMATGQTSQEEALRQARQIFPPFAPKLGTKKSKVLDKKKSEAWLKKRGIPVEWYDTAQKLGGAHLHGYYQNAAVYLWTNGAAGTEFHEAFHFVFRSSVDEKQRDALYKEMRTRINKSDELKETYDQKLAELRKAFPNASVELLALEEMMADEFADYVTTQEETAKTLPAKIKKFFKDLYAIIKSLFKNPLTMKELYSVIESGYKAFPAERGTSFMQDMAPRMVQEYADEPELHQDIVNTLVTDFENQYKKLQESGKTAAEIEQDVLQLMGDSATNRGKIAETALLRGFSLADRETIDENSEEFEQLKAAFHDNTSELGRVDQEGFENTIEELSKKGIFAVAPKGINEVIDDMGYEETMLLSESMQNVYFSWMDEIADPNTGNIASSGWRTAMLDELQLYGYTFGDTRLAENALSEDEMDQYDKIYSLGSFEQLPDERLSPSARALLHSISDPTPNELGLYVNYNGFELYRKAIKTVAGADTINEMRTKLRGKAAVSPELGELASFLEDENTPGWAKATLFRALRVDYTKNVTVVQSYDKKGGVTQKSTKIVNSDNSSAARQALQEWRANAIQGEKVDKPTAVYVQTEEGLRTKDTSKEKLQRAQLAYKTFAEGETIADRALGLSDLLWEVGVRFGDNQTTAAMNLQTYLTAMAEKDGVTEAKVFQDLIDNIQIANMVKAMFETAGGRRITDIKAVKENPTNIFTSEGSSINYLGEQVMGFVNSGSMATFVSGGKTLSAFQSPTDMNDMLKEMGQPSTPNTMSNLKSDMTQDPSFSMGNQIPYQMFIYRLMGKQTFKPEVQQVSLLRDEEDNGGDEYRQLTPRQELQLKIDMYLNNGNKADAQYFVSTQETRGRFQPVAMPRFTRKSAMQKHGITDNSMRGWIRGAIMQELVRVGKARDEVRLVEKGIMKSEDLLEGYHDGGYNFIAIPGVEDTMFNEQYLSDMIYQGITNGHITPNLVASQYEEAMGAVTEMANRFMQATLETAVSELKDQIVEYNLWNAEEKDEKTGKVIKKLRHNFDNKAMERLYKNDLDLMLREYVENDFIFRYEMSRVTRGNMAFLKPGNQLIDFYKRNGLLNSPGITMFIREEEGGYGADPFMNVANMQDTWIYDEAHNVIADRIQQSVQRSLELQGMDASLAKEEAKAIADEYKTTANGKGSDAQAFLSEEGTRQFMMGEGLWNKELRQHPDGRLLTDDEWFQEYMESDEAPWLAPTTPRKYMALHTFAMGNTYAPSLQKNSFVSLTRDFTAGHPLLDKMRREMRAKNIHVVNTISGEKGAKRAVADYENGGELIGKPMETRKFRQSQTIMDKKSSNVRLNIQITKNQFAGIQLESNEYKYDAGVKGVERQVSGQQVFTDFHESFVELQRRAFDDMKQELGFDALMQPLTEEARNLAKLQVLQNIRKLFIQQKIKNNMLDDNVVKQMEIVKDFDGSYNFALPMTFAQNQKEYENMFWAIFKKRILRMNMPGKELVQVASPGAFSVFNFKTKEYEQRELQYMSVDDNGYAAHAEVMVRADILEKLGLQPGDDLSQIPAEALRAVGYRIPHQGKSSTVIMKVVGVLPASYSKSIVLPANVTVMTGSDFDVDKMFVIFPETTDAGDKLQARKGMPYDIQTNEELRNNMFNSLEAMSTSPLHAAEQFRPLTTDRVEGALKDIGIRVERIQTSFVNPLIETEISSKFKQAQSGVGVFANAMSGQAVAILNKSAISGIIGVPVHDQAQVKYINAAGEAVRLTHVTNKSKIDNSDIMHLMQEMVSAFVDAGNKPVPAAMNLNPTTYNAFAYMAAVGVPVEDLVRMLQMPLVKEYIKMRTINEKLSPRQAYAQMARTMKTDTSTNRQNRVLRREDGEGFRPFNREMLDNIMDEKETSQEAMDMFYNFMVADLNGQQLATFLKSITPDTMQNMGEIALFQEYTDNVEKYQRMGDKAVIAPDVMQSFLGLEEGGVSQVPVQSNYYNLYKEGLDVSSQLFVTATEAFDDFKNLVKDVTGQDSLTAKQHREINRRLHYNMASMIVKDINGKDINPLAKYLTVEAAERIFLGKGAGGRNIATRLEAVIEVMPELKDNKFIASLRRSPNLEVPGGATIEAFNTDKMDANQKNALSRDFHLLLNEPETYTTDSAQLKALARLTEDLISHSLISSSMSPGYGNYYHAVPTEFFLSIGLGEFARSQERDVRLNRAMFTDPAFLFEFMRNYGLKKFEGRTLVQEAKFTTSPASGVEGAIFVAANNNAPLFIAKQDKNAEIDKLQLYVKAQRTDQNGKGGHIYMKVERKGYAASFDELNLRNESGDIAMNSILSGTSGRNAYRAANQGMYQNMLEAVQMLEGSTPEAGKNYEHKCE